MKKQKAIATPQTDSILDTLQNRFMQNMNRHKGLEWKAVLDKLTAQPQKIWSLSEMQRTGGEPDLIAFDKKLNEFIFCDCSEESPVGRRSLCYDREGLESRKEHKPKSSAQEVADEIGIELLTEEQYRDLQKLGPFDTKTSSWIKTPEQIRVLGGALFADYRFGRVFTYHNTAPSYYASRGFRGLLKV